MKREIAQYHVGLKVLLRRGDEYLFLHFNNPSGGSYYDWSGGRIDVGEEDIELMTILDREIREELGPTIQYKLGKPAFVSRRFFPNAGLKIFLTMFEAQLLSGEIQLSDEHVHFEWLQPKDVKPESFVSESEYQAWLAYLKTKE